MSPFVLASVVLLHGVLLDGTGGPPVADSYLEIKDGRIAAVGRATHFEPRPGDRVVDATGKWIVPGYIDTHTHLFDSGSLYTSPDDYDLTKLVPHEQERRRIQGKIEGTLDRFLCSGVTTVTSLGGPRWELPLSKSSEAPHVITAGPFLANFPVGDVTLWTREDPVLVQLTSPEAARAKVRELRAAGVGILKVGYAGDHPEELAPVVRALVDEGGREGLRVAMHAEELAAAKMALESGVQVLAHTVSDRLVDEDFLSLAKAKGVVSISGLAHFDAYRRVLDESRELLPVERRCGDPEVVASWKELGRIPEAERPPMPPSIRWGSSPEGRRILLENVRRLYAAGVPIAVGTNGGNVGTLQGPSFHRELRMLVEAGIPLADVLVAATRNGALGLGVLGSRGTLEAGKAADFVVLDEDPLASVDAFSAISSVTVAGIDVEARRIPAEPMSYRGALWLEGDAGYGEMLPAIGTRRVPGPHAAAYALFYCDRAGIDVTERRIWKDAPAIFARVSDARLLRWYQRKNESLDPGGADDLARPRAHMGGDDAEIDPRLLEPQDALTQGLFQRRALREREPEALLLAERHPDLQVGIRLENGDDGARVRGRGAKLTFVDGLQHVFEIAIGHDLDSRHRLECILGGGLGEGSDFAAGELLE